MPIARFQMPDGRIGRFEVPDGISPDQAQSLIQSQLAGEENSAVSAPAKLTREQKIQAIPGNENYSDTPAAPVAPAAPAAPVDNSTWQDKAVGMAEVPIALAKGAVSFLPSAATALLKQATGYTNNSGDVLKQEMQRRAYTPSPKGQEYLRNIGDTLDPLKIPPVPGLTGGLVSQGVNQLGGAAARQIINAPRNKMMAVQEARVAKSYEQAPVIDAAKDAHSLGISINPDISNKSKKSAAMAMFAGDADVNHVLSQQNKPRWNQLAREDMELPSTEKLTEKAFDKAMSKVELTKPYEEIKAIPKVMVQDEGFAKSLESLYVKPLIGNEKVAGEIKHLVDSTVKNLYEGMSGEEVLKNIRNLRQQANDIRIRQSKGVNPPSGPEKTIADTQMTIADTLESVIESNMGNPKLVNEYRAARQKIAQIFDWKNATDIVAGQVDPTVLTKFAQEGKPLSEIQRKMANVAGNFPEIVSTANVPSIKPRFTRAGGMGSLGAVIGGLVADGAGGYLIGGALGAGASETARRMVLNKLKNPSYQAANAIPKDYRPPAEQPVADARVTSNLPVPYDPRNSLTDEYVPNWIYGKYQRPVDVRPEVFSGRNLLAAPSDADTMALVQRQQQFDKDLAKKVRTLKSKSKNSKNKLIYK